MMVLNMEANRLAYKAARLEDRIKLMDYLNTKLDEDYNNKFFLELDLYIKENKFMEIHNKEIKKLE
ncbi:MAG: hypothetical protein NZ870_02470 [bacterium]|nr:hypothetical protein [bacterium]